MGLNRGIGLAMAVLALALAAPAGAQENLDSGKSGAQLFASNCALCHKSAQALRKSGGPLGLSGFLREHYTSGRESAAIIATYLESLGTPSAPGKRTGATKVDEKKGKPKSGETKSVKPDKTDKPPEAKTSGPKTSEPKTSEPKSEPKPPDAKASEPKPDAAPAAKPDKPEKSD